ncbi:hypothetical protein SDC9_148983 [bioreactor metagenome]|uniref:Uncharacterized protein n=1 Tax=bioreactor metagenome TaxID=1076179 RepID=A0A645EIK1_9ZZZZ
MMELATPGNKTWAMAFWGIFYYGGSGIARLGASLLVASGILAANWSGGRHEMSYRPVLLFGVLFALLAGIFLLPPVFFSRPSR